LAGVQQVALASDAGTVFAHMHARHLWKEAMLLLLLERIPFHQCLVFFNSRTRCAPLLRCLCSTPS
jgi:hypothetical protein